MIRIDFHNLSFDKGIVIIRPDAPVFLKVEGHSGSGKKGEDIVCAAVSALAQTTVLGITRIAGVEQNLAVRDGFIQSEIDVKEITPRKKEALKIILDLFCMGIFEILRGNEEFIEINFENSVK